MVISWYHTTGQIDHHWYHRTWDHPISNNGLDVFVLVSLSYVNVWSDDDTAARAFLAGYTTADNPSMVGTQGTPAVYAIKKCTSIRVQLDVYGNIEAGMSWVVFSGI
jgi:hypothetical protein